MDKIQSNAERLAEELATKIVIPDTNLLDKLSDIPAEVWARDALAILGLLFRFLKK